MRFRISDLGFRVSTALLFVAIVGCGGDATETPSDELSRFVVGVADSAGTPKAFGQIFARGAVPSESERKQYGRYAFWAKDVSLSGDSATVTVEVSGSDDQVIAEVEWTAVREDGRWKLKDAPLP